VAVKIWKNVGRQLKDRSGRFVLPDDPRLDPICHDIAVVSVRIEITPGRILGIARGSRKGRDVATDLGTIVA
jgi:hypothetical protein